MSDPSRHAPPERARRLLDDALALVDTWRLAGRWRDALTLLAGVEPVANEHGAAMRAAHALATARLLSDQAGFGGFETWEERSRYLDAALAYAQESGSAALLGAVWDARGMSLHQQFLDTGRAAEQPEELSSFEQGLSYRQQAGDQRGVAESLFHLGMLYGIVRGDHAQALPFLQQSYALAQSLGDAVTASYAIRHIAFAQHEQGDIAGARASLQESLDLRERAGFIPGVAMALAMLAYADADLGQRELAQDHLRRAGSIFLDLGAVKKAAWIDQTIAEFQTARKDS